jgi:hypothetical protein
VTATNIVEEGAMGRGCHIPTQETDMKHTETGASRARSVAHAADALRRAQELADCRADDGYEEGWAHLGRHVGDLSALAAASLRS